MKGRILVTGGAGYIGSHIVRYLCEMGQSVIVLDNLKNGFAESVPPSMLVVGDIADQALLDDIFQQHDISSVMNFASFIEVGESVSRPSSFYRNNVAGTICLLDAMVRHEVQNFIFSSTAAIFGSPLYTPIDEAHPRNPINPYGRSKLIIESILADYEAAYGMRHVALRYFNAAGASPDGMLGERHDPETHLIPLVLQAASGRRCEIRVFGDDYDTPDGTCIRDYVHVCDLAQAHFQALEYLEEGVSSAAFNLGNGSGFSIRQVVETGRRVTGVDFQVTEVPRRFGDPPVLIADASLARSLLGWAPQYSELETIIAHAWAWEQQKGSKW